MRPAGQFFNEFADTFDSLYGGNRSFLVKWLDRHFRPDIIERFKLTFDFLGDLTGRKILDIGCGSGPYIVEALRREAASITGIDPARRMLSLAREKVIKTGMQDKVTLVEGYFPHTIPSGPFDYAIVMGVMDYIENPEDFFKRLMSVVTQRAVLSFPSIHWLRTPLRKIRYRIRHCPVYFYNRQTIESLLARVGINNYSLTKINGAGLDYFLCISL